MNINAFIILFDQPELASRELLYWELHSLSDYHSSGKQFKKYTHTHAQTHIHTHTHAHTGYPIV